MNMSLQFSDFILLLRGAGTTLLLTFWAMLGGTLLGVVFGLVRSEGPAWISLPLGAVLDVFRSVPLLIQLILLNSLNAISGLRLPIFTVACVVLAIYAAAYCTEVTRGGLVAVAPTTRRAGRSLGMTYLQDLRHVVFPIALRVALPNCIGLTLSVMKDTSLVLWIGISELLRTSQAIVTRTQEPLLVLLVVGLIYFVIGFPIARLGSRLERRWSEQ